MTGLLRTATVEQLRDEAWLTDAIAQLGLERPTRMAAGFPDAFGGLGIWQTPIQFAPYLIALSELNIRSYAELGVHTGGSLAVTVEYLERFAPLEHVIGVDMEVQPVARERAAGQPAPVELLQARTDAPAVEAWLDEHRPDLVFVDADHSERGCRADYELASRYARFVALHDIVEWTCRGVGAVWGSIDAPKRAWTAQYDVTRRSLHGIGLVGPLREATS